MGGLSIVTGSAATATAAGTYLLRHHLPAPAFAALIHAAISGFIVSVASSDALYAKTPWILGKDRNTGRFIKGSRVAAWPFHVILNLRLALRRAKSKEPLIQEVGNGWYIGGWPPTEAALPKGDLSVVDCTSEYPRTFERPYICLPTWDTQGVAASDVKRGVEFALQQRRLGRAVLVHCAHGHGRSAQVLIASMVMAGDAASIDAALSTLQAARPKCKLNRLQRSNLEEYLSSVDPPKH